MKKSILFLIITLLVSFTVTFAQVPVVAARQVQKMDNAKIGGTAPLESSATLEIESTTHGILIPRMNSDQRDAINSPANALLIFNTSNNSFEVYKNTCTCWVTVVDQGNSPASSLVNTAPTASALNYTGEFRDGGTARIVYTYADAQGDAEGETTLQWEIANDASGTSISNLSTGASVTFIPANAGRYVRIKLTPRAATGILNGIAYYGPWIQVASNALPYASVLNVAGTVAQGSLLTGNYLFNGGSGFENTLGSDYSWQSATNDVGLGIQDIAIPVTTPPQTTPAHTNTIRLLSTEIGRYIRFGVKAKDDASLSASNFVYSNWVGPVTLAVEAAPIASNVTFSPSSPGTNVILTANYTFSDANEDPEGISLFQWYTADDVTGNNQTAIAGATARTFKVTNTQSNKYIGVGVTPVAATGITTGTQVVYYDPIASLPSASFTFTSTTQTSNNFHINRVMDANNKISVTIDVTSPGSISFTTTIVNGYSFSEGGTYTIGTHTVDLTATGTQLAYNTGGDAFTITGLGTTEETTNFTVTNINLGATFTSHYNGILPTGSSTDPSLTTYSSGELFSNNGTCVSKPISVSACVGSTITIGSNTYNIANINGQCWMTNNLNELPGGVAVVANQWLATPSSDLGFYGYFNNVTTNGSAGWATSEFAANRGLLYQWSAAMLGSTTERAQGICPSGWHIPSDCEWMYLEHGLGMSVSQQTTNNSTRSNTSAHGAVGNKLRSEGSGSNNASGFSAVLSGSRDNTNGVFQTTNNGRYWSSSLNGSSSVLTRTVSNGTIGVFRSNNSVAEAFSVRCLKD